jgi:nucleotide-binding universal stress UspA family protein
MNPIRSLLVHLDASPRSAERLRLARTLAAKQGATVSALFAVTPIYLDAALAYTADANTAALLQEAEAAQRQSARATFEHEAARPGLPMEWAEPTTGPASADFAGQALYADLMLLGQHDRKDPLAYGVPADFVQSVLIESGKPALVVPYVGTFADVGREILVAWKPTREAARAVSAALPLLQQAQRVHVVSWDEGGVAPAAGGSLEGYLRAHAVQTHRFMQGPVPQGPGEALLSLASDVGADLLVMGCYGHTRTREFLLGGATRTVLESMTLPVLMAH